MNPVEKIKKSHKIDDIIYKLCKIMKTDKKHLVRKIINIENKIGKLEYDCNRLKNIKKKI